MKYWKRAVRHIGPSCNMSWSVLPFQCFFWRLNFFYGDHFTIEGRQKATFWKSELGALLLCRWSVVIEYQWSVGRCIVTVLVGVGLRIGIVCQWNVGQPIVSVSVKCRYEMLTHVPALCCFACCLCQLARRKCRPKRGFCEVHRHRWCTCKGSSETS